MELNEVKVEELNAENATELETLEQTEPAEQPVVEPVEAEIIDDDHAKYVLEGGALVAAAGAVTYGVVKLVKFIKRKIADKKAAATIAENPETSNEEATE